MSNKIDCFFNHIKNTELTVVVDCQYRTSQLIFLYYLTLHLSCVSFPLSFSGGKRRDHQGDVWRAETSSGTVCWCHEEDGGADGRQGRGWVSPEPSHPGSGVDRDMTATTGTSCLPERLRRVEGSALPPCDGLESAWVFRGAQGQLGTDWMFLSHLAVEKRAAP